MALTDLLFSAPSGSSSSNTNTTVPNLSAQQSALYPPLLGNTAAYALANPSDRVSGYNRFDTAAADLLDRGLTPWYGGVGKAQSGLEGLLASAIAGKDVSPNALSGIPFNKNFADFYMSPDTDDVIDRTQEAALLHGERNQVARNARLGAGSYGGSRQAVQDALAEEALNKQVGDQTAQLRQAGFTQAQQQFERDRQARQFDINKGLEAAALSQKGISTATDVARGLTDSSRAGFGMTMDQINALNQRANLNRKTEQDVLNYPLNSLQILANVLRSVPYGQTVTGSGTSNATNSVNPLAGSLSLVSGLAGVAKSLGIKGLFDDLFKGSGISPQSLGIDTGISGTIGEFGGGLGEATNAIPSLIENFGFEDAASLGAAF